MDEQITSSITLFPMSFFISDQNIQAFDFTIKGVFVQREVNTQDISFPHATKVKKNV